MFVFSFVAIFGRLWNQPGRKSWIVSMESGIPGLLNEPDMMVPYPRDESDFKFADDDYLCINLAWAVFNKHLHCVKNFTKLMLFDAENVFSNETGLDPYYCAMAAYAGHLEILKYLLSQGKCCVVCYVWLNSCGWSCNLLGRVGV